MSAACPVDADLRDRWLVWVATGRGASPQMIFADVGQAPFLDEGIRSRASLPRKIAPRHHGLPLERLACLYPLINPPGAAMEPGNV